ncbi:MAG: hypothetical protein AAFW75_06565 [Cyanobacteria bacterium J06636_16]
MPFVLQVFTAVGLVGYLSFKNGQEAVEDLADQLVDSATQRVDDQLDSYLSLPQQLGEVTAQAIATAPSKPTMRPSTAIVEQFTALAQKGDLDGLIQSAQQLDT